MLNGKKKGIAGKEKKYVRVSKQCSPVEQSKPRQPTKYGIRAMLECDPFLIAVSNKKTQL